MKMRKWALSALCAVSVAVLSAVTAYADVIMPIPRPRPAPTPTPPDDGGTLVTALIVAIVVIAVGVAAWIIVRNRRANAKSD